MNLWNNLIRFLYNNKIKYWTDCRLSPTPDDCGLPQYYDRLFFITEKTIHFDIKGLHKNLLFSDGKIKT
jgi:hypothetical protein